MASLYRRDDDTVPGKLVKRCIVGAEPDAKSDVGVVRENRFRNRVGHLGVEGGVSQRDAVVSLVDCDLDRFGRLVRRPDLAVVIRPQVGAATVLESELEKPGTVVIRATDRNSALVIDDPWRIDRRGTEGQ